MLKLPTALPTLTGRWLAGYRVIWCAVAALALCGATWGSWIKGVEGYRAGLTLYNVGLAWDSRGGMKIGPLGPEAIRAGVTPASELIAIEGQPVSFSVATE